MINIPIPVTSVTGQVSAFPNDLSDGIISGIGTYADDTTLYSRCDQASDLWQQLELASELESDLQGTVDWVGK